jgi:hypothetical protein
VPAGDLSPDQTRYVDLVVKATGLERTVVTAWVGQESGWGTNKAGHNYLNIGPGRTYASTEMAAAAAAGLINASSYYVGIRAAIPAGGAAQIKAIGESPWGTIPSRLVETYGSVLQAGLKAASDPTVQLVATGATTAPADEQKKKDDRSWWEKQWQGFLDSFGVTIGGDFDKAKPYIGEAAEAAAGALGEAGKAVGGVLTKELAPLTGMVLKLGLTLIITVAGLAVASMGLNRLTGISPGKAFKEASGVLGTATGAGGIIKAL